MACPSDGDAVVHGAGETHTPEKAHKAIRCFEQDEHIVDETGAERAARRWAAIGNEMGDMSTTLSTIAADVRAVRAITQLGKSMGDRRRFTSTSTGSWQ